MAAIIQTCLRFKPEQRPSAKEVLALLELVAALEGPPQGGQERPEDSAVIYCCSYALNTVGFEAFAHAAASTPCRSAIRSGRQHGGGGRVQGLHRALGAAAALRQRPPPQLRRSRLDRRPQGMWK